MASQLVIPIFIPHMGCPHQCVFCDQTRVTGQPSRLPDSEMIRHIVHRYLSFKGSRSRVEAAFFGGNFLGLEAYRIRHLLDTITPFIKRKEIHGIRFSTRPDTVTKVSLSLLDGFPVSLVELGIQSLDDEVLAASGRGHSADDSLHAISHLQSRQIGVGVQVMAGLPTDTRERFLKSCRRLADLSPVTARIYPLVVFENTVLSQRYQAGKYTPLSLSGAVKLAKEAFGVFTEAGVKVIRMGLAADDTMEKNIVAGPWHPAFGHLVFCEIMYDRLLAAAKEADRMPNQCGWVLKVNPKSESRLRGDRNQNLLRLASRYPHRRFCIEKDPDLAPDRVKVVTSLL